MNTEKIFLTSFAVCFVCFILRTAFNILKYKKSKRAHNKAVYGAILLIMFVLWFSWGWMVFTDPVKIDIPEWLRYLGLALFVIGVSLFILSHIKLKGFEGNKSLVRDGIYSRVRNPMYSGFILWVFGFPLFMQAFASLASGVIWSAFFIYWKALEEKELEEKYAEYRDYKKRTWF